MQRVFQFLLLAILFTPAYANPNQCDGKQILGRVETVTLVENHLSLDAKLDTGASMASLTATDINIFERNNEKWVSFTINLPKQKIVVTKPLIAIVHILKRKEEASSPKEATYAARPVVNVTICLGKQIAVVQTNLIDRSDFHYPLLLGTEAIKQFKALVDVERKRVSLPACEITS